MAHSDFAELTVEDLQGYYSDFHKDFYGWRPRSATPEQWRDRAFLVEQINHIHDAMDAMKATPEGRAQLRAAGWVIEAYNTPDNAEVIDPAEYAEWSAELDAQYYGEAQ